MGENQPRGEGGTFGSYEHDPWLDAVEKVGSGSTKDVHEQVCQDWEGSGPAYKTTFDKLHDLADDGKINRQDVGGNWQWTAKGSPKESVFRVVKEKGPARAEVLAEFSDIPEEEFEGVLRELEEDGRVVSELTGNTIIWQPA